MTPLQFERLYEQEWTELQLLLELAIGQRKDPLMPGELVPGDRVAALYRRACEHLALARARSYPAYLLDRLERLTADAHQVIYHRRDFGLARLRSAVMVDFPRAVRSHGRYVAVAAATFLVPTFIVGWLVYTRPEYILSIVDPETASMFEEMYSPTSDAIGRRDADTDWVMFGYYIRHNIGLAFQCFAAGLFAGLGSLFFLAFNGAVAGAVAGYLTERGFSSTFYPFVATHSSFELTAAVLAGAAGLRIGHALLAPGRLTRGESLIAAARGTTVMLYGITAMLLAAAAIEAFWSSATWVPPAVKYTTAAVCWITVLAYLTLQGRRAD